MVNADPENVMRRTRAENADYVIEQVRALGLNPHPTSRLMRMQRALNRGHVPFEHPDFPAALEAERDMQHLGFVFSQINSHRDSPKFLQLAKDLLSDSVLPQDNREQSPGRDAQFELYLAAICQNTGLLPVDYVEPDVTCVVGGRTFGIAAKRIKSMQQVRHHVRKAADQIGRSKHPGVIALDLSLAWNRSNAPIISRIQSQVYLMILEAQGRQFFDEHAHDIHRWVAGEGVVAVVVFNFRLRLRPGDHWGLDGMTTWMSTVQEEQGEANYQSFYRGFLKGIPNLTDLDAEG
jgi:hypothetical protein